MARTVVYFNDEIFEILHGKCPKDFVEEAHGGWLEVIGLPKAVDLGVDGVQLLLKDGGAHSAFEVIVGGLSQFFVEALYRVFPEAGYLITPSVQPHWTRRSPLASIGPVGSICRRGMGCY